VTAGLPLKDEEILINGYKPHKKLNAGSLTVDQKKWNTKLSEV
jgi:hypothetical protein